MYVYIYICMYVYVCICMYVCMYTYLMRFIAHYLQLLGCSIKDERKESIEMHKPLADWSSVTDFCFWWPQPIQKKRGQMGPFKTVRWKNHFEI